MGKIKENIDENQNSSVMSKNQSSGVFNLIPANFLLTNQIDLLKKEKFCLLKAIEFYQKAIKFFDHKQISQQNQYLLNSINWDLSSTYFCLACLLQDNNYTTDGEKLIIEYMNFAIDNLKLITVIKDSKSGLKKIDIDNRLAVIHHRLASLYHHLYRLQVYKN
jgi:hypothetical protein